MDETRFNLIKEKWSKTSSWAVWAKAGEKPKSYVGDLGIFNIDENKELLNILNPNIIMVGLNVASRSEELDFNREWGNFHDPSPRGHDYKIRYAFEDTKYWGAYMTDFIKEYPEVKAGKVKSYLKKNPQILEKNASRFKEGLNDIGEKDPLIIVFGGDAYSFMEKANIHKEYKLIKITHYSHFISKKSYRKKVLKKLEKA